MDSITGISYYLTKMLDASNLSLMTILSQQDTAPGHFAFNTVQLQQCKTVNFLSPDLLPHNSPDA